MKVLIDNAIPFINGVLEPWFDVVYLPGAEFDRESVRDCDALVIRTRTKCNGSLLAGSRVRFIATATIGTDHIDLPWCAANGIEVFSAQGCNSGGVMQYVFTALYEVARRKGIDLNGKTLGVIGVGHVGSKVARLGQYLGFDVLTCDPPRKAAGETDFEYIPQAELLSKADIVTLHVPLDATTRGMADSAFFEAMRPGAIFFNASRGPVVVDSALKEYASKFSGIVIDTWNGEPRFDTDLQALVDIGTMHIAGYSKQGKINGTTMCVHALARHFGIPELERFKVYGPAVELELAGLPQEEIRSRLASVYDICRDDASLRANPDKFEQLRNKYDYRDEFTVHQQ